MVRVFYERLVIHPMLLLSLHESRFFPFGEIPEKSSGTFKTYASAWKVFARFCEEQGIPAFPASASVVTRYLRYRAFTGKSASTIRVDYSAIKAAHAEARRSLHASRASEVFNDPTENEVVQSTMRDLTYTVREKRRPVNRIHSLTREQFDAIKATACIPRVGKTGRTETKEHALRRGKVDIALISVMRDCTLCRYDVICMKWGAIMWRPDGTALLTVPSRKANEIGYTGRLGRDTVRALKAIRSPQGQKGKIDDSEERIFPMTTKSISNRIIAACSAAGL